MSLKGDESLKEELRGGNEVGSREWYLGDEIT